MRHCCKTLLMATLCLLSFRTAAQSTLEHWELRYPGITSDNLASVAFGANRHVAVGWAGTVLVSEDAMNWSRQNVDPRVDFWGVRFLNDKFFAVGKDTNYQGVIFTSADGKRWTQQTLPPVSPLMDVAFGNGRYIAIGSGGYSGPWMDRVAVQSLDGINWTTFTIADSFYYGTQLLFWNSAFWATHWGGIRTSPDGRRWTQVLTNFHGVPRIAINDSTVVAVGLEGQVQTSLDGGKTWAAQHPGSSNNLYSVTYATETFVAVGTGELVFSSPDGLNWISRPGPDAQTLFYNINYGGGKFVAVGYSGALAASTDGVEWTHLTAAAGQLTGVATGPDSVVAVGPGIILTSLDGTSWSRQGAGTLYDVTYGQGQYVAVGNESRNVNAVYQRPNYNLILTSPDGLNWSEQAGVTNLPLHSVAYGNGMFLAAGGTGALNYMGACVIASSDGVKWELTPAQVGWKSLKVIFGNGIFVVSGYQDVTISADGRSWQRVPVAHGYRGGGLDIAYGEGKFFGLSGNREVYVSTNALDWQLFASLNQSFSAMVYGAGRLVLCGGGFDGAHVQNSRIISSKDGQSWSPGDYISDVQLIAGVFSGRSFFLVGESGTILESQVLPPPPFPARAAGRYAGLFYERNGVYPQSSGYIQLRLMRTGSVEGALVNAGKTHPFTATLDADSATASFTVPAESSLDWNVALRLELGNEREQVLGTITADSWQAEVIADHCPFNASTHPAPFQGRYTLVIPPDIASAGSPEGFGYASVRLNGNGKVIMEGKLADNQRISQTSFVSSAGDWPFFVPLYEGGGSALGWMRFADGPALLNAHISWTRPAIAGSRWFATGFSNEVANLASPYKLPANGRVLGWRNGVLILRGGDLPSTIQTAIVLNSKNSIVSAGPHFIAGTINRETGLFNGTVRLRGSGKTYSFRGAVLQNQQIGLGFFTGANSIGEMRLGPQPW